MKFSCQRRGLANQKHRIFYISISSIKFKAPISHLSYNVPCLRRPWAGLTKPFSLAVLAPSEWMWARILHVLLQSPASCFALYGDILLGVVGCPTKSEMTMDGHSFYYYLQFTSDRVSINPLSAWYLYELIINEVNVLAELTANTAWCLSGEYSLAWESLAFDLNEPRPITILFNPVNICNTELFKPSLLVSKFICFFTLPYNLSIWPSFLFLFPVTLSSISNSTSDSVPNSVEIENDSSK